MTLHKEPHHMNKLSLLIISVLLQGLGGCSTATPSRPEIDSAGNSTDYWRDRYERQCIDSGIRPGTPMLVKCVNDLMDIRSGQQD